MAAPNFAGPCFFFFLSCAAFSRVKHNGLSEKETTRGPAKKFSYFIGWWLFVT